MPVNNSLSRPHILENIFNINPKLFYKKEINESISFFDGGFVKLTRKNGFALLRLPKYIFRPANSDALHIDIWQNGSNWVRDAGTYSYALENSDLDKFSGTKDHSTIEFDNKNQMPRISRFLYSNWLKVSFFNFDLNNNYVIGEYKIQSCIVDLLKKLEMAGK